MPLSGVERARSYKENKRQTAQEYAEYFNKKRNRYHREKGKIKLVSEMASVEMLEDFGEFINRGNVKIRKILKRTHHHHHHMQVHSVCA